MVRIKAWDDIDKQKLKGLFRKRGHGVVYSNYLSVIRDALNGKRGELEVHQCRCGELMTLSKAYANVLRKKHKGEDIPCKVCGKRNGLVLDMKIHKRFKEITDFLNERYVFTTKSASTLKPKDAGKLQEMALGIFPTNSHAEMLVGYLDFVNVLAEHFPTRVSKYHTAISQLFDNARIRDSSEFDRLYSSVLDWEESHKGELNVFAKEDILDMLLSEDAESLLQEEFVSKSGPDLGTAKIQLQLSAYKDTVEIKAYLDILANVLTILAGKPVSETPFKGFRMPSTTPGGKPR